MDETGRDLPGLLDGLPLALARAGSHLRETGLDITSYVRDFTSNSGTIW
jgi:hypothetical protein